MNPEETATPNPPPLRKGERLIWQGRSGRTNVPKAKRVGAILLGLLLGITALIAPSLDPADTPTWLPEHLLRFLSDAWYILLILAAGLLLYPLIIHRILSRVYYIVTDQRLITLAVPSSSGALPSPSPEKIDTASIWYTTVQGVTCTPVGDELCHLRLWIPDTSSPEHRAVGVLYLPQDIAEYISTQCRQTTP